MERISTVLLLENRIAMLKEKLGEEINSSSIGSESVLEISRELDTLIVGYYNLKKSDS